MIEKLTGKNIVVFDTEIQKTIDGIAVTWAEHHKMGLSVACAFDYRDGDYKVYFEKDGKELCERLNDADLVVGFNTKGFDNLLMRTFKGSNNEPFLAPDSILKNWDILEQSRLATGWTENARFPKGLRLDDHLLGTFGESFMKTADGADAPKMFQDGHIGKLVTYCLADVRREKTLFEHIVQHGWVKTATHGQKYLDLTKIMNLLRESNQ